MENNNNKQTASRGVRNNNPGNIRRGSAFWAGQVSNSKQTDKDFVQFVSIEYGLRAMFVLIHNYGHLHDMRSIEDIITRWAPPYDNNNTKAYIKKVCDMTGLSPKYKIMRGVTIAEFKNLVKAMCWVESNYLPSDTMLENAYRMAFCFMV